MGFVNRFYSDSGRLLASLTPFEFDFVQLQLRTTPDASGPLQTPDDSNSDTGRLRLGTVPIPYDSDSGRLQTTPTFDDSRGLRFWATLDSSSRLRTTSTPLDSDSGRLRLSTTPIPDDSTSGRLRPTQDDIDSG